MTYNKCEWDLKYPTGASTLEFGPLLNISEQAKIQYATGK